MTDYKEHIQLEGDMCMLESSLRYLKARTHELGKLPIWACDDIKDSIKQLNELIGDKDENV